jgi:drug/metabolite transporter (DMT)-like permease
MNTGSIKIIAGACLFGLIPLFVRLGSELSIVSIALGRAVFAAVFARTYLAITKEKVSKGWDKIFAKNFFYFVAWTLFLTLAILFYFLSIQFGSVSISGVLLGVHPVFVVFFVFLFFREKISFRTSFSCFLALLGIAVIAGLNVFQEKELFLGSLFALASAIFLALNFTYYLKYLKGYSAGKLVYYQNILQIPLLIPFVVWKPGVVSMEGILAVFCLGIFCTGIAYFLIYSGSQTVKKQHIGVLQIVENVIPLVLGIFLFNEQVGGVVYTGIVLVISAVLLLSFEKSPV